MAIDWSQFIPGIISTFVGFVLALLGQAYFGHKKDINSAKQCLLSVIRELKKILNEEITKIVPSDPNMVIRTPVWDSIVDMYKINLLKNKKVKGEPKLWYTHLLEMYNLIKEFNKWSEFYTQKYFSLYFAEKKGLSKEAVENYAIANNFQNSEEDYELCKAKLTHEIVTTELSIFHEYIAGIKSKILNDSENSLEKLIKELEEIS